jgi:2-polyprenyl-3-methyl-5-hydroxy-6-metoxy-1,4-benzoquinol methylase
MYDRRVGFRLVLAILTSRRHGIHTDRVEEPKHDAPLPASQPLQPPAQVPDASALAPLELCVHCMSTDRTWEHYGRDDPYFGVLSHDQYRRANLSPEALREFFDSGAAYVENVLRSCQRYLGEDLPRAKALDFGCGVGRLTLPLARRFEQVVGIDVSAAMLAESERNAGMLSVGNVSFHRSLADIADARGTFSFVNSYIVLQHVSPARGVRYVSTMLQLLSSDGFGAIHATYGREKDRRNGGVRTLRARAIRHITEPLRDWVGQLRGRPPRMQMNSYPLNQLMFMLQDAGAREVHAQFTNHGGHLGTVLLFRKHG